MNRRAVLRVGIVFALLLAVAVIGKAVIWQYVGAARLEEAIELDDIAGVRQSLDGGAEPNGVPGRVPPLWKAVGLERVDVAGLLLDRGADPHLEMYGEPIFFSITKPELVDLFVNAGVDPDMLGSHGKRALHEQAFQERVGVIEALLRRGANVNAVDDLGQTPLHVAAAYDRADSVRALLANGADPSLKDTYGDTPLDEARGHGDAGVLAAFDEHGGAADPLP